MHGSQEHSWNAWSTWHMSEPLRTPWGAWPEGQRALNFWNGTAGKEEPTLFFRSKDKPTYTERLISCEDITAHFVFLHDLSIWSYFQICNKKRLDQQILPLPHKALTALPLSCKSRSLIWTHDLFPATQSLIKSWCLLDVCHWEMGKTTVSLSVHIL